MKKILFVLLFIFISGAATNASMIIKTSTAHYIAQELKRLFPNRNHRGLKQKDFYVLKHTTMPAVLIETEFLSNPEAREFLCMPKNQLDIAIGIRHAVQRIEQYK